MNRGIIGAIIGVLVIINLGDCDSSADLSVRNVRRSVRTSWTEFN